MLTEKSIPFAPMAHSDLKNPIKIPSNADFVIAAINKLMDPLVEAAYEGLLDIEASLGKSHAEIMAKAVKCGSLEEAKLKYGHLIIDFNCSVQTTNKQLPTKKISVEPAGFCVTPKLVGDEIERIWNNA